MAELLEEHAAESTSGRSTALPADGVGLPARWSPPAPTVSASELPALKRADGNFVTTLTLNSRTCKWPIGDPTEQDFHYCGRRPQSGRPYCDAHELRSYQPLRSRTNRSSFFPRSR
jgi:GcrA cell cycle regulator